MSRPLITLKTLTSQARETGEIELPTDALITPAARDWLAGTRMSVRRVDGPAPAESTQPTVYLVGDAKAGLIRTLLPQLEREYASLRFLPCQGHLAGCLAAVGEMCEGLEGCSRRRGIVIVRNGAIVNCVANKFKRLRAAILSRPSDLYVLMRELSANLLILERERLSFHQMAAAIDEFVTGKRHLNPVVTAAIDDVSLPSAGTASGDNGNGDEP